MNKSQNNLILYLFLQDMVTLISETRAKFEVFPAEKIWSSDNED